MTAYILAYNPITPLADPVQSLFDLGQELKALYADGGNSCGVNFGFQTSELNAGVENQTFDVNVFPNPTNSSITIQLENNAFDYGLCDLNGKQIVENNATLSTATINCSTLNPGVYFLTITQNGKVGRKKVVKM